VGTPVLFLSLVLHAKYTNKLEARKDTIGFLYACYGGRKNTNTKNDKAKNDATKEDESDTDDENEAENNDIGASEKTDNSNRHNNPWLFLIFLGRRLIISAVVVLISDQYWVNFASILVLLAFLVVHLSLSPFREVSANTYQTIEVVVLLFTFTCIQTLAISAPLFACVVLVNVVLLVALIVQYFRIDNTAPTTTHVRVPNARFYDNKPIPLPIIQLRKEDNSPSSDNSSSSEFSLKSGDRKHASPSLRRTGSSSHHNNRNRVSANTPLVN